jgi:hypothetical protein
VGLVADDEPIADRDAGLRQLVDLGEQRLRIDDHPVADDAADAGVQDARGQQPEHELAPVRIHGVPGVVAALIARHNRKVRRQQVDDLSLAFVAPLRAQDCDVHVWKYSTHFSGVHDTLDGSPSRSRALTVTTRRNENRLSVFPFPVAALSARS